MIKHLSILLPTYNCLCVRLVNTLHTQCRLLKTEIAGFDYEIVVADDCSPDRSFVAANNAIRQLEGVRYLCLGRNLGRSAIRNFLAHEARSEWLLFIDGDLQVENDDFIYKYVMAAENHDDTTESPATTGVEVVVGGTTIGGSPKQWNGNLRWRYEKLCEEAHSAANRQKLASREFRTTNFLVPRKAVLDNPFDENFHQYGYEDVLFGKRLCQNGYGIRHIDNPVVLDDFEPNDIFVAKTEEACRTLLDFKQQLRGYSRLLDITEKLARLKLSGTLDALWRIARPLLKRQLCGQTPNVKIYNVYKLLYMTHIWRDNSKNT